MTTASYSTTQLSVLINNAETFFANLAELNLNGILGECISAAAANAPSCLIFNAANAQAAYNAALLCNLPARPALFTMNAAIQPSQASVKAVLNGSTFVTAQNNHLAGLNYALGLIGANTVKRGDHSLRNVRDGACNPSSGGGDANMLSAAGVLGGAGAGLVGAGIGGSAVLGTSLFATITTLSLFTVGVVAIGIALAVAGYYAYNYVKQKGAGHCIGPRTASLPGGAVWNPVLI